MSTREEKLKRFAKLQENFNQFKENRLKSVIEKNPNLTIKKVPVKGFKGDKGDMPTKEELTTLIKSLIPEPIKGDKPTQEELLALIKPLIPKTQRLGGRARGGGGGLSFYSEVPSGTKDGSNLTFTLTYAVATTSNSVPIAWLTVNGKDLIPNTHFTISAKTLTISNSADAPKSDDDIYFVYGIVSA